jgi:hypothetical protein
MTPSLSVGKGIDIHKFDIYVPPSLENDCKLYRKMKVDSWQIFLNKKQFPLQASLTMGCKLNFVHHGPFTNN